MSMRGRMRTESALTFSFSVGNSETSIFYDESEWPDQGLHYIYSTALNLDLNAK